MKKITVLGDVMNEPLFLNEALREDGTYDYCPAFAPLKSLMDEADCRIANLETPLAGEGALYSRTIFDFNAPDSLADALRRLGIDALSFANNHAFDRGEEGILRTLKVLRERGFSVTGAYADPEEDRVARFEAVGTRVAWIAYTATTNKKPDPPGAEARVNRLCRVGTPWMRPPYSKRFIETRDLIAELLGRKLAPEERTRLCRILGEAVDYGDDCFDVLDCADGLKRLQADYEEARRGADVVLFLPHIGGQFNVKPGSFSRYIAARAAEMGFDAVLASHSHTTQAAKHIGNAPVFYSLGNVSMTHTVYTVEESLPQYGLAAHLYTEGGKIVKTAFSIIKMVWQEGRRMEIWPTDELLEKKNEDKKKAAHRDGSRMGAGDRQKRRRIRPRSGIRAVRAARSAMDNERRKPASPPVFLMACYEDPSYFPFISQAKALAVLSPASRK